MKTGGSGSELFTCRNLKRNFISCELHPIYYNMILDRLNHDGDIDIKYRLDFIQQKLNRDVNVPSNRVATLF